MTELGDSVETTAKRRSSPQPAHTDERQIWRSSSFVRRNVVQLPMIDGRPRKHGVATFR
jgi:hypothetical protein